MQELNDIFQKQSHRDDIIVAIVSLLLTVALHFALFKVVPAKWNFKSAEEEKMSIEILPPLLERKTPEFIEANPYGNELKPLKDAPESFKNQRVADELPEKNSKSSRPFVKGEDKKYKKIISGTSDKSDMLNPAQVQQVLERPLTEHTRQEHRATQQTKAENSKQQTANKTAQKQAIEKSSSAQKSSAEQKSSSSTKLAIPDKIDATVSSNSPEVITVPVVKKSETAKSKKSETLSKTKAKTIKEKVDISPAQEASVQKEEIKQLQDIPAPRPRPRLSMKIPAGPLLDSNKASSNAGVVSVDSRFSEFGAYQQRMIEAISRQWNLLGSRYDLSSAYGSQVMIEFSLNTEGELVNFKIIFSTSTNTGSGLCEQAIQSTAPYGVWTQEMVNALGTQPQQVRINFLYR